MALYLQVIATVWAGCFCASLGSGVTPIASSSQDSLPIGDPRRCLLRPEDQQRILTFEGLPGGGWDNLRNKESGLVTDINYTQCRFTGKKNLK